MANAKTTSSRRGGRRSVNPIVAVIAVVVVVALIGGIWWKHESNRAAAMAHKGDPRVMLRKALQNPENQRKLKEATRTHESEEHRGGARQ